VHPIENLPVGRVSGSGDELLQFPVEELVVFLRVEAVVVVAAHASTHAKDVHVVFREEH
jgi:hypothetical protein